MSKIEVEGHLHDGLVDAYYTAKLFKKLEMDPEYKGVVNMYLFQQKKEALGYSLGNFLQGIVLEEAEKMVIIRLSIRKLSYK